MAAPAPVLISMGVGAAIGWALFSVMGGEVNDLIGATVAPLAFSVLFFRTSR